MFGETKTSKKERAFHKVCEALCEHGRLTAREREVFVLLAKGAPVSAIEEKLFISTSTVSTHMKHIYQKLGVHSRGELYDLVDAEMNAFLAK
ncbi:MAG: helix-turn-helix transcriptional regulator [Eggerthellaceae bacterium]|nr:helix-turn-helix transcriptional regulator [Eggerthellaceae bacterium]